MLIPFLLFAQFTLADSLYDHQIYDLACTEYKRTLFFYPDLQNDPQIKVKYAISLFHINQNQGRGKFRNLLEDTCLTYELKTTIAQCYLDSGLYYEASQILEQRAPNRLLGYTYLLDNRLYSAREVFLSMGLDTLAQEITSFIHKPKKSQQTAALLSMLLPGSGEIYAGNKKRGIQDFLLNLGTGMLIYNAIKQKKYVDGMLIFSFLFNRFYLGSIHNAQKLAIETNEKSREIWLDQMKKQYFSDLVEVF